MSAPSPDDWYAVAGNVSLHGSAPACSAHDAHPSLACRFVFDFEHCTQYYETLDEFMTAFNASTMKICSTKLWLQPNYVSTVLSP